MGEKRSRELEVHLRQYAKLKRDIDAGGTINFLRERYGEAKGTLEEHLRNVAHAMDGGPQKKEPRDEDEPLQGPHPPTPTSGASEESEGDVSGGSMQDPL